MTSSSHKSVQDLEKISASDAMELPENLFESLWRLNAAQMNFDGGRPLMARHHVIQAHVSLSEYVETVADGHCKGSSSYE